MNCSSLKKIFNLKLVNSHKKLKRKMSVCSKSEMLVEPDPVISSLEIESIPPLPLFALYAADHEKHEYTFLNLQS